MKDTTGLTIVDIEHLQQARRHVEAVKEAIYSGKRGSEWHKSEGIRETFSSLSRAEGALLEAVMRVNANAIPNVPATDRDTISWPNIQRRRYHAGRLEADQIQRLQALPGWTWQIDRQPISEARNGLD